MHPANEEQAALWNGLAGRAWVDSQTLTDQMFRPLEALLVAAVAGESAQRVLDVGCGAGGTTLAIARQLGATGHCLGVDISAPLVAAARKRAEREGVPAGFVHADAQHHAFAPASFDMIVSRLGVMFFDDAVGAFSNLRHAASDGAALRFIAWRDPAENPFMTAAERAVAPLLPDLPTPRPNAPGQFGFAARDRIHAILEQSGWGEIEIQPVDVVCTLPEHALTHYVTRFGPVGRALNKVDERTRAQVIETARAALAPYVHGDEVRYTAACWMASARARAASTARKDTPND